MYSCRSIIGAVAIPTNPPTADPIADGNPIVTAVNAPGLVIQGIKPSSYV